MDTIVDRLSGLFRRHEPFRVVRRAWPIRRGVDERQAVADALAAVRERREVRLRAALDGRLERAAGGRAGERRGDAVELLVLGRGHVEVPTGEATIDPARRSTSPAAILRLGDAPLVVRAAHGVEVQAPPLLARIIVEAYRRQLDIRYGPAERARVSVTPVAGAAADAPARDPLRARVWIAPDGRAFARTPLEARDMWVPLDIRL